MYAHGMLVREIALHDERFNTLPEFRVSIPGRLNDTSQFAII